MALRFNTAIRNFILANGSYKQALQNGVLKIYTGTQPASADDAATGTLLVTISNASGAYTAETPATGTVTLSGAAGSVDSITVNSVQLLGAYPGAAATTVAFATDLATTAANTCTQINDGTWWHGYTATNVSNVITLKPTPGKGATVNTHVVAFSGTTLTASTANMSGGVTPVNGLDFAIASNGIISKGGTWSGVAGNSGTAGWFRFVGADATYCMDGNIAVSGANLNMTSTSITASTTTTIDTGTITQPAA